MPRAIYYYYMPENTHLHQCSILVSFMLIYETGEDHHAVAMLLSCFNSQYSSPSSHAESLKYFWPRWASVVDGFLVSCIWMPTLAASTPQADFDMSAPQIDIGATAISPPR